MASSEQKSRQNAGKRKTIRFADPFTETHPGRKADIISERRKKSALQAQAAGHTQTEKQIKCRKKKNYLLY